MGAKHHDQAAQQSKPPVISHTLPCELLPVSQGDQSNARFDETDERRQRVQGCLPIQPVEALTDQDVRHHDGSILDSTNEPSQASLCQMVSGECRDCFVDDGLDDDEAMLDRIPLGCLKLTSKAVAPGLGF